MLLYETYYDEVYYYIKWGRPDMRVTPDARKIAVPTNKSMLTLAINVNIISYQYLVVTMLAIVCIDGSFQYYGGFASVWCYPHVHSYPHLHFNQTN